MSGPNIELFGLDSCKVFVAPADPLSSQFIQVPKIYTVVTLLTCERTAFVSRIRGPTLENT